MIDRKTALKAIARHVGDSDIVIPVYSTAFDWIDIHDSPLNYTMVGAMGLGSSHGIGLALGFPDRKVIVLDGDGSLLMNLPTLVSTAEASPTNMYHFVFENKTYEANGGHPTPNCDGIDFATIARGAGYSKAYTFSDLAALERDIEVVLTQTGPVFICIKVVSSGEQVRDYFRLLGPHAQKAFREAVAQG